MTTDSILFIFYFLKKISKWVGRYEKNCHLLNSKEILRGFFSTNQIARFFGQSNRSIFRPIKSLDFFRPIKSLDLEEKSYIRPRFSHLGTSPWTDNMDSSKTPMSFVTLRRRPLTPPGAPKKPKAEPKVDVCSLLGKLSLAERSTQWPRKLLQFSEEEPMDCSPGPQQ